MELFKTTKSVTMSLYGKRGLDDVRILIISAFVLAIRRLLSEGKSKGTLSPKMIRYFRHLQRIEHSAKEVEHDLRQAFTSNEKIFFIGVKNCSTLNFY